MREAAAFLLSRSCFCWIVEKLVRWTEKNNRQKERLRTGLKRTSLRSDLPPRSSVLNSRHSSCRSRSGKYSWGDDLSADGRSQCRSIRRVRFVSHLRDGMESAPFRACEEVSGHTRAALAPCCWAVRCRFLPRTTCVFGDEAGHYSGNLTL